MKKAMLYALLILLVVCGCNKYSSDNSISLASSSFYTSTESYDVSITNNSSQTAVTSSIALSEDNRMINKPMQYFFVNGLFVGGYLDQKWISSVDPNEPYNRKLDNRFLLKDILDNNYKLYTNDNCIVTAKQASFFAGDGPGGIGVEACNLIAPFSESVDEYGEYFVFDLPTKMSGEIINTLSVTNYGFSVYMSTSNIPAEENGDRVMPVLSTNAGITLPKKINWSSPLIEDEKSIVQNTLKENGVVYSDPQIAKTTIDWNGDDKLDTLLFVNMKRDSYGYAIINPENKVIFSFILLIDSSGISKTIFSLFEAPRPTDAFHLVPYGVFDLNNDGLYEICFDVREWEGGYTAVLSHTSNTDWEVVLRGNYGT